MSNKNPRFGGRSKFSAEGIKAALIAANGKGVQGEIVDGEVAVTNTEETGQTPTTAQLATRDVATTSEVMRSSVTAASCVRALEKAVGFGKNALYLEVGVALACFASSSTGADLATKRVVMGVYQQAGFEVEVNGRHYKTVNRRINASAALFNKLGESTVKVAMQGMRDGKAIDALCSYLSETHKFDSINAVLEFVGKAVLQTNTPEVREARAAALVKSLSQDKASEGSLDERIEARRTERTKQEQQKQQEQEELSGISIYAGNLHIAIPRDARAAEVRAMAEKLMEFADRLEAELGTPEEQRNREMHS